MLKLDLNNQHLIYMLKALPQGHYQICLYKLLNVSECFKYFNFFSFLI